MALKCIEEWIIQSVPGIEKKYWTGKLYIWAVIDETVEFGKCTINSLQKLTIKITFSLCSMRGFLALVSLLVFFFYSNGIFLASSGTIAQLNEGEWTCLMDMHMTDSSSFQYLVYLYMNNPNLWYSSNSLNVFPYPFFFSNPSMITSESSANKMDSRCFGLKV